jgi:hypothetical protein
VTDDEKRELEIELMALQVDKTRLDIDRVRQEMRWEPWKALAGIIAGVAAVAAIIIALSHYIH